MEDLTREILEAIERSERTLVICLTQKMAEEISDWLIAKRIRSAWLHAEVKTLDRVKILHKLRKGVVDVVVGINLLREGLDLPEVGLVAILDADRQGYLRSTTALIQIIGRAARHESGRVIMYSDSISPNMHDAINETQRVAHAGQSCRLVLESTRCLRQSTGLRGTIWTKWEQQSLTYSCASSSRLHARHLFRRCL